MTPTLVIGDEVLLGLGMNLARIVEITTHPLPLDPSPAASAD